MRNHCPLLQIEAAAAEHDITTAVGAVTPINGSSSGRVLARQRAVRGRRALEREIQ